MGGNALILLRRKGTSRVRITMDTLPKFINGKEKNISCLRLVKSQFGKHLRYYRDGGDWEIGFYLKDGRLYLKSLRSELKHFDNVEVVGVSEEEWRKCNWGYAPKNPKI